MNRGSTARKHSGKNHGGSKGCRGALILGFSCLLAATGCRHPDHVADGERFVWPSNPALHYGGRWDRNDPNLPRASWPGFSLGFDVSGRSVRIRMNDAGNYYNIEIDGTLAKVVGGQRGTGLTYTLADHLAPGRHHISLQRRNISFEEETVINGIIVDAGAEVFPPATTHQRRIEFIGDSYTVAEGNEAKSATLPWREKYPVTNFAAGYAALLGRAMRAEIMPVCRSGSGVLCDWQGSRNHAMAERYRWSLMEHPQPEWKFDEPQPDLVVIALGLNDHNGLKLADGTIRNADADEFRLAYRKLIAEVRIHHPQARIVALAPPDPWVREQVRRSTNEERMAGGRELYDVQYDDITGGYVADGHPTVESHRKIAGRILAEFQRLGLAGPEAALPER